MSKYTESNKQILNLEFLMNAKINSMRKLNGLQYIYRFLKSD